MTKLIVLIAVVATFAIAFACTTDSKTNTANLTNTTNSSSTVVKNTPVSTPAGPTDELAAGHQLYTDNCAKCHKDTGEGGPTVVDGRKIKPDNLTDDRRKKLSDDKYVKTMVEGVEDEGMPSFKDKMTEAQMREVVKYIRVELQKQDASNVASADTANPTAPPSNK
jgi:mono/diheme cytochrome c family protein